jgi:hypothetical protein
MARSQEPNVVLRRLLAETGWTEDRLARAVNEVGAEAGLSLRYGRSAVSHWLAGRRPWVPALLAEALSRGLGRPVTVADIGLATAGPAADRTPGNDTAGTDTAGNDTAGPGQDAAAALIRLAGSHRGRGAHAGRDDAYRLAALTVPAWPAAVAVRPACPDQNQDQEQDQDRDRNRDRDRDRNRQRLTAGQVAAAEEMLRVFSDTDTAFGGGQARTALAAHLAYDIAPRLRITAAPVLRSRMFAAATALTYLCGFMCFDDEQHAMAQRYYRIALDLAAENGDPAAYAITLRSMSVQAHTLGHLRAAAQLAEAAATTSKRKVPLDREPFFLGQMAVAAAADGDRPRALRTLSTAERRLHRATSAASRGANGAMGAYHLAALAHQEAAVRAVLGDRPGAISALSASVRARPPGERRSRAITTASLAELQLADGNLEEAAAAWHAFLDDYPFLRSGRAATALRTMRSRLRPYAANRSAARLLARAAALSRPAAGQA